MRVLGFDLETTGLDIANDRILEIGAVIYDTDDKIPLSIFSHTIMPSNVEFREGYESPTGLKRANIIEFGRNLSTVFLELECMIANCKPDAIVGHNIVGYDLPLTRHEAEREKAEIPLLLGLPVIDTRHDLPFKKEPSSRRQEHLAAEHGFLNPFPHRALFDVMTCLRLLSCYSFEEVFAMSKIPFVVMNAVVSYDDRQKAKDLRYSWEEANSKRFPKKWVKAVRENAVDREIEAAKAIGVTAVKI